MTVAEYLQNPSLRDKTNIASVCTHTERLGKFLDMRASTLSVSLSAEFVMHPKD